MTTTQNKTAKALPNDLIDELLAGYQKPPSLKPNGTMPTHLSAKAGATTGRVSSRSLIIRQKSDVSFIPPTRLNQST